MQGLAIDGRIVRRSLLPAPREDADPLECPCPYGGLMGFALDAWLLVGHLCPERRPERLRSPFDERVPEELWTLETPVHPGLLATPFGHRRTPGIFLEVGGAGIALALFAASDKQPRGEDGTRSWEGLEQGEIGMALRALRDGGVTIGEGLLCGRCCQALLPIFFSPVFSGYCLTSCRATLQPPLVRSPPVTHASIPIRIQKQINTG